MPLVGLEPTSKTADNKPHPGPSGTDSGTVTAADRLAALACALQSLSPDDRARLVALLAAPSDGAQNAPAAK